MAQTTACVHTAIADLAVINSDGTAVTSLNTDENIMSDLLGASNNFALAEESASTEAEAYRVQIAGLQSGQVQSLIVSSSVGDQFQDSLTNTAGGAESSLPFVLPDNGGQPLSAAQRSEILSTFDVNALDPKGGPDLPTLRLKTLKDSQTRKVGEVTPIVVWIDTTKMPKGFNIQAEQTRMNQLVSSAGVKAPVILLPMTFAGSAGKMPGQSQQFYLGPTGGMVQVSSAWLQQQAKEAAFQQQLQIEFRQCFWGMRYLGTRPGARDNLDRVADLEKGASEFSSLYYYELTHPFSDSTPLVCKVGNGVAYGLMGIGLTGLAIVGLAPAAGGAAVVGEGATLTAAETEVVAGETLVAETLASETAATAVELGGADVTMTVANGVAKGVVTIRSGGITAGFVRSAIAAAKAAGARSAVISTGLVIRPALLQKLLAIVQAGGTLFGGRVVQQPGVGGQPSPVFDIIFDNL